MIGRKKYFLAALLLPLNALAADLKCECIEAQESFVESQTIDNQSLSCAQISSENYTKEINIQEKKAKIEIQKGQLILEKDDSANVDLRFDSRDGWNLDRVKDKVGEDEATNLSGNSGWTNVDSFKFATEGESQVAYGRIGVVEDHDIQSSKTKDYNFGVLYTTHNDGKLYGEAVCIEDK